MRSIGSKLVAMLFAVALIAAVPSQAEAQWFVAGSGGVSGFSGDDWDGVKSGFAAQGALGTRLGSSFSLAGLFGWSTHGLDESSETLNAISVELQPVVRIGGADGGASGFIGARGGYTSASVSDDGESANGLSVGPTVGGSIPLSDRASVGVAGSYSWLNLSSDDFEENLKGAKWGVGAFILITLGGGS
jgi:hypothetical protein